jgi:DNA (cytosine-5)-methyltransferase 1
MYTVGSLFSGIGGIDLAFSWAGLDVRWQVEIEPFCQAVLKKHSAQYWPNARILNDIRTTTGHELGTVDVMAGGFPCQDISIAGKRQGIKQGTRSGLWLEFARLIGEIRPRIVLLENVAAITTLGGTQVIADLTTLGYSAEWGIIPASAVGAPHRRERWFCVAYPMSQRWGSSWHGQEYSNDLDRIDSSYQFSGRSIELGISSHSPSVGNSECQRWEGITQRQIQQSEIFAAGCENVDNPLCSGFDRQPRGRAIAISTDGYQPDAGAAQSILGRAVNGLSRQLDGVRWPARPNEPQHDWEAPRTVTEKTKDRTKRLKALGNAVVPQVVYPLAVAIKEYLEAQDSQAR